MRKNPIKVSYTSESFEMESALISGRTNDFIGVPTAVYCGSLDLDEIHSALFYANRAVIMLLRDEFEVSTEECDKFVLSALTEALTKEWNVGRDGNTDVEVRRIVKHHNKNQN